MHKGSATHRGKAVVTVIMSDQRILVILRGDKVPAAGYWTPPAGKIEPGEDQPAAVIRETREEVGLTVQPIRCVWQCPAHGANYDLYWWLADPIAGNLKVADDEVAAVRWIYPDEFANLERTFPEARDFFADILPALPEWQSRVEGRDNDS